MNREELLKQWVHGIRILHIGHIKSAKYFENLNRYLGIPAIIISTVVGTSIFASFGSSPSIYMKVIVGLMSLLSATLSSLQTFLGYSERAEKHKDAFYRYGELRRESERMLVESVDEESQKQFMEYLSAAWNDLDKASPSIPNKIHNEVSKNFFNSKGS